MAIKSIVLQGVKFLVKKGFIVLLLMAMVIGIVIERPAENVVYASSKLNGDQKLYPNSAATIKGNTENFKTEFAYEMEQFTAKVVSAKTGNIENFQRKFAYDAAEATTKVMPLLSNDERNVFAYEMAKITTKIIGDQNLDVEKAKTEFAYEMAEITTKILMNTDNKTILQGSSDYSQSKGMLLRNNADIEQKTMIGVNNNTDIAKKESVPTSDIAPETYHGLVDELMSVSDRKNHADHKLNIDGELRLHYALNRGAQEFERDSSGIRVRLGFDTEIDRDWHAYGMLEGKQSLVNYNDEFKLSNLYVTHKIGESMVKAGSFGYLMAEGNIYDSTFKGARYDFGEALRYTLSCGKTDYTKNTFIATARYNDFDYNLEAGVYRYEVDDSSKSKNTIGTFGGNYNFSNFGVGAMVLHSSQKDSRGDNNGYVLSANYGELKTYRAGTYDIFVKYYNQPSGTYISHGMNGRGNSMQGFKGYGVGVNYTFAENLVAGIEHYNLEDKITGENGETWWSYVTRYF
jgi:hypothetical protein